MYDQIKEILALTSQKYNIIIWGAFLVVVGELTNQKTAGCNGLRKHNK